MTTLAVHAAPAPAARTVIVFHGQAENFMRYHADAVALWGGAWNIVTPRFTRRSAGDWRTLTSKARALTRAILARFRPHTLWGHSAGGQLLSRLIVADGAWLAACGVANVVINNAGSFCIPNGPQPWPYGGTVSLSEPTSFRVSVRVGEHDSDVGMEWSDRLQTSLQGSNRRERAELFAAHAPESWGVRAVEIVPNAGHSHTAMMASMLLPTH